MPVIAWIGIVVCLVAALPVLYFLVRSLVTFLTATRELSRPDRAAGLVEIKGPPRRRARVESGAGRRQGLSEEDRALQEALEKLSKRGRSSGGDAPSSTGRSPRSS